MSESNPMLLSALELAFHPTANENEAMNAFRASRRIMVAHGTTFASLRKAPSPPPPPRDASGVAARHLREEIDALRDSEATLRRDVTRARDEAQASRHDVVILREQAHRLQHGVEERDVIIERLTAQIGDMNAQMEQVLGLRDICVQLDTRCKDLTAIITAHEASLLEHADALRAARQGEASARAALIDERRSKRHPRVEAAA